MHPSPGVLEAKEYRASQHRLNMFSHSYWRSDVSFARPKDNSLGLYLVFLLTLSMASAAIDVFSVPSLGVFTANNTGNVVFLAIKAGQIQDNEIQALPALTSLLASWLGSFYSGQVGHRVGRAKRWFVFMDICLGACLAILCASLCVLLELPSIPHAVPSCCILLTYTDTTDISSSITMIGRRTQP